MISYLFSMSALSQIIANDDGTNLLHLICLCFCSITLQVDQLLDARLAEHVMASTRALHETQRKQQSAEVFEPNIGIAPTTKNLLERLLLLAHAPAE